MGAKRVLVVEDDRDVYEFLESLLQARGYNVQLAWNGKVGLDLVKEFKPDLIMLDLLMPRLDGFGFLKVLFGSTGSRAKVLVLSALEEMEHVEEALRLGASGYLMKPVDHHRLVAKIEELIGPA